MANFSGALLVCSLMKTARQQEKGAPSKGEEPGSHIQEPESHTHQWPGTWSWWPWDILPCWDVTSTKPPMAPNHRPGGCECSWALGTPSPHPHGLGADTPKLNTMEGFSQSSLPL